MDIKIKTIHHSIGVILTALMLLSSGIAHASITINTDISIDATDTSYDNDDIIIDGATVTIDGTHTFTSLTLQNNAVVTHTVAAADKLILNIVEH